MTNKVFSCVAEKNLYSVWGAFKARCGNPNNKSYSNYGGRGITVCPEWTNSFDAFYEWAKPRYSEGLTIDRVDNDGGYAPSNCRFAVRSTNAINRRKFKNNPTGVAGVVFVERKRIANVFRALITTQGKRVYLGNFDNIFDAAAARISAENRFHMPLMAGG